MMIKLVLCVLCVGSLVVAAPESYDQRSQTGLTSSDTVVDLVERFAPSLAQASIQQGGTFIDQLRRIVLALVPLMRALISLKGVNDYNYDTQARLADLDYVEHAVGLAMNFMKDLENLGEAPTFVSPEEGFDSLRSIAGVALEVSRSHAEHSGYNAKQRLEEVAQVDGALGGALEFIEGVTKQHSTPQRYQ